MGSRTWWREWVLGDMTLGTTPRPWVLPLLFYLYLLPRCPELSSFPVLQPSTIMFQFTSGPEQRSQPPRTETPETASQINSSSFTLFFSSSCRSDQKLTTCIFTIEFFIVRGNREIKAVVVERKLSFSHQRWLGFNGEGSL